MDVLKLILSFVILLLVPGYTLSFALFPDHEKLDQLERFFIAFASSLAITSLAGTAILKLDLMLNPINITMSLAAITFLFGLVALMRTRKQLVETTKKLIHIEWIRLRINPLGVAVTLVFFVSLLLAGWIIPGRSSQLSEFYFDPDWLDNTYTNSSSHDEITVIPVEIHNLEGEDTIYRVEVILDDQQIWTSDATLLNNEATIQLNIPLPEYTNSDDRLLIINLYKSSSKDLAATLRLYIDPPTNK